MKAQTATRRTGPALHEGFLRHNGFRWLKISSVLCVISLAAYLLIDADPRPNGGTALGYVLGTIGVLLILWLTALGLRKRWITRSRYSLKAWTSAHVYLGLSLITVVTLHTGFQFGWNVHTLAYALMMIVVLSGIYGIIVYGVLPRTLSANRGEATQPQMLEAIRALDRQLHDAAQPLPPAQSELVRDSLVNCSVGGSLWSRLSGRHTRCGNVRALAAVKALTREANLGQRLSLIVSLLERKEAALGQARRHSRTRALLEIWLYVHVPVTFALIAALIAHIVSVFFYW